MDGRLVIFAIRNDRNSIGSAAMDGGFVIFAITNDCMNTVLKWYYLAGTASNGPKATETGLRLH